MAETLVAGGDGAEGTGRQSARSHGLASALSRARERGKERGNAQTGRVGSDRAAWSGSTRWAGADRWARARQVGQD
jgi:hypothetical protein